MNAMASQIDQKPERRTETDDSDQASFSSMSDNDFVEFSEWDSEFNGPGDPGEVPPEDEQVIPAPVASSNAVIRQANGRLGCKSLENLKRQLLHKDKEGDEEDVKVLEPPLKRQYCVPTTEAAQQGSGDSVAVPGIIPGVQMSHPRHGCTKHHFEFFDSTKRDMTWPERTIVNKKHCSMCYCYVCEIKADKCKDFEKHCNANDRDDMKSYWKFQRSKKQDETRNRHFRFQCAVHIFRHNKSACPWPVEMWEQRSWFNKRFCRECVCFVCNKPVIDCTDWSEHCKLLSNYPQLIHSPRML